MIDLIPPLQLNGANVLFDKRDVNTRWLTGTVLTGFVGFLLMGGALFSATNGIIRFANSPTLAKLQLLEQEGNSRKGDKLSPLSYSPVTRQAISVKTRIKADDKEIVKTRNFIRLSAPLTLERTKLTNNIPSFSSLTFQNVDSERSTSKKAITNSADSEVSITYSDMYQNVSSVKSTIFADNTLSTKEILLTQKNIKDSVDEQTIKTDPSTLSLNTTNDLFISQSVANQDSAKVTGIKITEANMSAISKDTSDPFKFKIGDEKTIIVTSGTSLLDILIRQGMGAKEAQLLAQTVMNRLPVGSWKEGLKIQLFLGIPNADGAIFPDKLRVIAGDSIIAVAVQSDLGHYVVIDEQDDEDETSPVESSITTLKENEAEEETDTRISLYHALFETGLKNNVPKAVLSEFVRMASFDLDFERKVKQGDSIEFFYADEEPNVKSNTTPEILYSAITLGGNSRRFYRFEAPDDKTIDYYDENGKSAKRFLIRKPMNTGTFRSGFGSRRHPILGYTRMHTGVDWSAPRGTPILAAGNGIVESAGRQSGYGNYVLIKHMNGYETGYAHMSGYERGITEGTKVRQGQLIGYVGSTGQSTGNHLHYEVIVNGRFVDPLRIKIPQGKILEANTKNLFDKERERIDSLINRAPASTKVVDAR